MPKIYFCYRRTDSPGDAGRLYDRLVAAFGRANIQKDMGPPPGSSWVEWLRDTIPGYDAMVVIIGPGWDRRDPRSPFGDVVRFEIAAALQHDVRVIPVLVGGALMPSPDSLHPEIRHLARRNAVEISESRYESDVARLTEALTQIPRSAASSQPSQTSSRATPEQRGILLGREGLISRSGARVSPIATGTDVEAPVVFISYVEEDGATAARLAQELRARHQSTWTYEEDGIGGVSHLEQVIEVIDSCRAVVLIASKQSVNARNVIKEIEAAHEREKMLIPVRLGMTHQELMSANRILRMAIGTSVTLPLDSGNVAATATRIAIAIQRAR